MSTSGRLEEKKMIMEAVEKAIRDSGIDKDPAAKKKALGDSILSMIVMAQVMGFSRNDVILAFKDEWLQVKHLKGNT